MKRYMVFSMRAWLNKCIIAFSPRTKHSMVIDHSVSAHERNVNYGYKNKPEFRDKIMYFSMAANNPINAQYLINTQVKAEGCIIYSSH